MLRPLGYVIAATAPSEGGTILGGVAQLGERVNGIHEVRGSIPLASICLPGGNRAEGWKSGCAGVGRTLKCAR